MIPSGASIVIRILVLASAVGMLATTRVAGEPFFAFELVIVVLAVFCLVRPDSHIGLAAVILMAVHWLDAVDNGSTGWTLVAASAMCVFHVAMAAGSVGPPSAEWTTAMRDRWLRRLGVLTVAGAPVWLIMRLLESRNLDPSAALLAAALFLVAFATAWISGRFPSRRDAGSTVRT